MYYFVGAKPLPKGVYRWKTRTRETRENQNNDSADGSRDKPLSKFIQTYLIFAS